MYRKKHHRVRALGKVLRVGFAEGD